MIWSVNGFFIIGLVFGVGMASTANLEADSRPDRLIWGYSVSEPKGVWSYQAYAPLSVPEVQKLLRERLLPERVRVVKTIKTKNGKKKEVSLWMARKIEDDRIEKIAQELVRLSYYHQIDPALVLALIQIESSYRPWIESNKGAVGLMQVMPRTAKYVADMNELEVGRGKDLYDPLVNVQIGIRYLSYLMSKYDFDAEKFLAAYNAGPGIVSKMIARNKFEPKITRDYIDKIVALCGTINLWRRTGLWSSGMWRSKISEEVIGASDRV